MVSVAALQAALRTKLIAANITADVREANYQGADFDYPVIRIGGLHEVPKGDGTCHETISILSFNVCVESELSASDEASDVAAAVNTALFGHRLDGSGWYVQTIDSRGLVQPVRAAPNLWRAEAFYIGNVYQS
jgi:hypothetical protein